MYQSIILNFVKVDDLGVTPDCFVPRKGSGFPLQSFCSCLTKRISTTIPNARLHRIR